MPDSVSPNPVITARPSRGIQIGGAYIVLALIATIQSARIHNDGVGITPDSVIYICGAEKLAAGAGFVGLDNTPITMWPLLYSVLLAAGQRFSLPAQQTIPLLQALLYVTNTLLAATLVFRCGKRSLWALLTGGLVVLTARPILEIHAMAWSEPLFITLLLVGLFLITEYVGNHRYGYLVGAAVMLAYATRGWRFSRRHRVASFYCSPNARHDSGSLMAYCSPSLR